MRKAPTVCAALLAVSAAAQDLPRVQRGRITPRIAGDWWTVAGNPDLGALQGEQQEPADFAIWQAKDGTWQLWSCIRNTKCGGMTRLFYRWEGRRLGASDWKPMGIAMQADPALGETPGGLQAPHVVRDKGVFHMVYGDWNRICLQQSRDGKTFERVLGENGQPDLFAGPYENTRDPMLMRHGDLWLCYYSGLKAGEKHDAAAFVRTSADLRRWSEPMVVSAGGTAAKVGFAGTNAECPFVVEQDGWFVLFRNLEYGRNAANVQYASRDPFCFGVGDDVDYVGHLQVAAPEIVYHDGQYYIAALSPGLDGIRIARLVFEKT